MAVAHDRAESAFAAVQVEIDEERAATLGRVSRTLEAARRRHQELAQQLRSRGGDAALVAAHREARDEAEHWRWVLCVQREAIGLYDHRWVDRVYPPLR